MSWLKALGKGLLAAGKVAPVVGPIVSAVVPGAAAVVNSPAVARTLDSLDEIANIIMVAEVMGQQAGSTGAQKLAAATPLVIQSVLATSVLTGKTIADPALFQLGCQKIGSGMADVLNSLQAPAAAESQAVPTPPVG